MKSIFKTTAILLVTATLALASGENWMTDWVAAKAKAKAENKPILINLTGSDWCAPCLILKKQVFTQKAFQDYATQNLILFEADFPKRTEQPPALKEQNAALEKAYLAESYPTVLVLDADGKKLSEDIGALKGGPDAFIAKIKEVIGAQKK
jgi:protein disulfide-isomerase